MKVNKSNIPSSCPSCGGALIVVRLECSQCGTEVTGEFNLCPVCRLDGEIKKLFDLFIDARGNLKQVQRELGLSIGYITHNLMDAFVLGDRLAVIQAGRLQQVGPIQEVFQHPNSLPWLRSLGCATCWKGMYDRPVPRGLSSTGAATPSWRRQPRVPRAKTLPFAPIGGGARKHRLQSDQGG